MSLDVNQVKQFATYVDKRANGGNGNGYVDGSEVSVFKKKIKTADRTVDVDSILADYSKNKATVEVGFDNNGTKSDSSVENAIIAAMTPNTALRSNDKSDAAAKTIAEGIKNSDENTLLLDPTTWFNDNGDFDIFDWDTWFNDQSEMVKYTSMITKDNVMDVVADDEVIEAIASADSSVREQAGQQTIAALVAYANEKQIDVSNIVKEENGKYLVGRDVADKEILSDATSKENCEAVITALRDAIKEGLETADGNGNPDAILFSLARRIDADTTNGGNNNGYIDSAEEIKNFKQAAAEHGYDIGTVLEEIRDNDADGVENTSNLQKTVANIFDPTKRALAQKAEEGDALDVAKAIGQGIGDGDDEMWDDITGAWDAVASWVTGLFEGEEVDTTDGNKDLLDKAITRVNSSNVMTVLKENSGLIDKILNKYNHGSIRLYSNKDQNYTKPIIEALIQCAQENNVIVDDIVMTNGSDYIVGGAVPGARVGSDALHWDNVSAVIAALQARLEDQIGA